MRGARDWQCRPQRTALDERDKGVSRRSAPPQAGVYGLWSARRAWPVAV